MKRGKTYLLDTDIVIYWLKNKYPKINKKIKKIDDERIFISSISVAELYFGAFNSAKQEENKRLIDELLEKINVIHFDESAAECFGEIKYLLKSQGNIISDSDLFIAAAAVSNNLVLVTNNERHFERIVKLEITNWTH
ncbi:MAG: PIN domain-containing protein [Candidatus Aminicenantes bacterium]|jgi:tRNA(fMet)-specific endonuclease VapC